MRKFAISRRMVLSTAALSLFISTAQAGTINQGDNLSNGQVESIQFSSRVSESAPEPGSLDRSHIQLERLAFILAHKLDKPKGPPESDYFDNLPGNTGFHRLVENLFWEIHERVPGSSAVPLPAAGWMFFSGLAGLGAAAWRRRRPS